MNPKALVVINGDDVYEDLFGASLELQSVVSEAGFASTVQMGMARFAQDTDQRAAGRLNNADLVVLYTAMGEFDPEQQQGLARAVGAGMGLVAIHASNVFGERDGELAQEYEAAFDLFGSRYASHGPPPHESRYSVHIDATHPITAGIEPFSITHEHYQVEQADDHNRVLAWRLRGDDAEPLVYVREVAQGRVCYLQFGHDMRAWREPSIRTMIARAAQWATRKDDAT